MSDHDDNAAGEGIDAALADLQARVAFLDDELAAVNRVLETQRVSLAQQAEQIETLRSAVRMLTGRMPPAGWSEEQRFH